MTTPALIINIVLLLVLLGVVLRGQRGKKAPQPSAPQNPQPGSPEQAFQEAQNIVQDATKKAETIVTAAEIEGMKLSTESSMEANVFRKDLSDKIDASLSMAQKQYFEELEKVVNTHKEFVKQLEQKSILNQQDTESQMRARINELLFSLEQNLTNFLNNSEQKSIESISLELKSARSLIDAYRTEQLRLIDENIVAVVERTISLVIKDKIDIKDQLDLVYEALEKAKIEKFFA